MLQNLWVDVERIDVAKSATQTLSGGWQGHQRKHKWMDDPRADDYSPDGNPARKTDIVKVCNPLTEDVNDPEEWVSVPLIHSMKSFGYDGDNNTGTQSRFHTGLEDDFVVARKIISRKIIHYDTNIDDAAQAACDADPTLRAFVVPGSDYQRDDATADDSQFVDHEIVVFLKHRYNQTNTRDGGVNTGLQTKLKNQYLIDESLDADGKVVGLNGIDPPYRLDPWQNIVNVKFKTIYLVVEVSVSNESSSSGPFGASPSVATPVFSCGSTKRNDTSVRLLDTKNLLNGNIDATGYRSCLVYGTGVSAEEAYTRSHNGEGWLTFTHPPDGGFNGTCTLTPDQVADGEFAIAPIDFVEDHLRSKVYLFTVPVGDGNITVDVSGLVATFDTGPTGTGDDYNQVSKFAGGTVAALVYSTVRKSITKIDQLIDISGDGKLRPTEDDQSILNVNGEHQGKFKINVKLDSNKAHQQIDNYGNKFQPYKVTFTPDDGIDHIPAQPPPRLPK